MKGGEDDEQNLQKCFTLGGILLELISEQFNVHAFWSSLCTGPMFTTYRAHTRQEPKIKAENGVVRYLLKLETLEVTNMAHFHLQ